MSEPKIKENNDQKDKSELWKEAWIKTNKNKKNKKTGEDRINEYQQISGIQAFFEFFKRN